MIRALLQTVMPCKNKKKQCKNDVSKFFHYNYVGVAHDHENRASKYNCKLSSGIFLSKMALMDTKQSKVSAVVK